MSRNFIACELGERGGRVVLGSLHKDKLTLSEMRRFENIPLREDGEVLWDVAQLYQDVLLGLRDVGTLDEPIESLSCTSWVGDYLLFHADGSFIPPTYHYSDPRTAAGRKEALAKIPWTTLYETTGVHHSAHSTLYQLGAEKTKRLKRADHLMPVADGLNFLFSGAPCVERSSASATQLYDPRSKTWSGALLEALRVPARLFSPVVAAGTKLKPLRSELAKATQLENPIVIASCSNELAATIAGLPAEAGERCAFLRLGEEALIGVENTESNHDEACREGSCTNTAGYGNSTLLHKPTPGLWIVEECRRFWAGADSGLDEGVMAHLAASSPPLESLINLNDPRFATPGDMPLKVRAFCRETDQPEPRKPGPVIRCILESLALHYRQTLDELLSHTGQVVSRLYVLGETRHNLLNHFIANALQLPVVVTPADATAMGTVIVQALALGRIPSLDDARQLISQSFKTEIVLPHNTAWTQAYDRYHELSAARAEAIPA